ncbi:MAG: alpha/beta fold hydrolase [Planctomycetaceae bacterium]
MSELPSALIPPEDSPSPAPVAVPGALAASVVPFSPGSDAPPSPAAPAEGGACPPPLQWQEVLREVTERATHWTVEVPGTQLTGLTLGEGPPLIFLNSLAEPRELSFLLAWLLRDQFRCVLFDWRGVKSPQRGPVTLDRLVADLFEIADHWPGEPNRLLATGLGGLVGLRALHDRPRQFTHLTLVAGYAHRQLTATERFLAGCGRWLPGTVQRLPGWRAMQRHSHRRFFPPFDETRFEFFIDRLGRMPIAPLCELAQVIAQTNLSPLLPQIENPVLLIETEGTPLPLREAGQTLARQLPHATLEELHNTGLIPAQTHPHRIAKLIRPAGE